MIKRFGPAKLVISNIEDNHYVVLLKLASKSKVFTVKVPSKRHIKSKLERMVDVATRRKVYFYRSGMDCDGVEFGNAIAYKNIHEAEESQEHDYNWADGPMYFNRMTKEEYLAAKPHRRDRAMEAFENGHPHSW